MVYARLSSFFYYCFFFFLVRSQNNLWYVIRVCIHIDLFLSTNLKSILIYLKLTNQLKIYKFLLLNDRELQLLQLVLFLYPFNYRLTINSLF